MELDVVTDETLGHHPSLGEGWVHFLLSCAALCEPGGLTLTFGSVDTGRRVYVWSSWTFFCLVSHAAFELPPFTANTYCMLTMCQALLQMLYGTD